LNKGKLIALVVGLMLSSGILSAELAVFTDGRVLRVEDAKLIGDVIRLELIGGGVLEVPALRIDRVVDDEIDHSKTFDEQKPVSCRSSFVEVQLENDIPFADLIEAAAEKADLHPRLLAALVQAESDFDPKAISRVGAQGLTQLMPSTALEMAVAHPFDPAENLRGGALYLRRMLDRFKSLELALAAYNAGIATVEKYEGVPPYRETHRYIKKILTSFCSNAMSPASP